LSDAVIGLAGSDEFATNQLRAAVFKHGFAYPIATPCIRIGTSAFPEKIVSAIGIGRIERAERLHLGGGQLPHLRPLLLVEELARYFVKRDGGRH